jgi:hypothetical protein
MRLFWLLFAFVAINGCATGPSTKNFPLRYGDPVSVRECRFVAKFPGPYGYRFWGSPPVLADFSYRTALKAKEMGATDIYWREDIRDYHGQTRVTGYAFDCSGVKMPTFNESSAPD